MNNKDNETQLLNKHLSLGKLPEYNVLFLGETGVGKSTTINAWANYMRYKTFDEAKYGEFELMTPAKFKLPNPVTNEPNEKRCSDGDEKIETLKEVGSQMLLVYTFKFKDKVLRIIDTPGFGDNIEATSNIATIDPILTYLNYYQELNAIVILVKANQTRTTSCFRHFISELFNYLHKDASKNLIFCFTFSQNANFQAGEGYHAVKEFLSNDLPDVHFELKSGENCFFIDNKFFRYLDEAKSKYNFDKQQERNYCLCWNKSAEQINNMWDRTRKIKPYNLTKTISLYNSRKFIFQMAEPLVRLQTTIKDNIRYICSQKELLQKQTSTKTDLEQKLNIEVDSLESELLKHPKTICTDAKCIELINSDQLNVEILYKTKCHPQCYLTDVIYNAPGHSFLRNCAAINFAGQCIICGCRWEKHQYVTFCFKKVKVQAFDENFKKQIKSAKTVIDCIKTAIQVFDDRIKAYQAEYEVIQENCAKFAYILMNNFTTKQYNEPYFDLLIGEENAKIQANSNHPKDRLTSLKDMKKSHQVKVERITKAIKAHNLSEINLEDIYEYKKNLLKLKLTGNQLKQMLETASLSREIHNKRILEEIIDFASNCFSIVTSSSNSGYQSNNNPKIPEETNYVEKLITNQVNILSIIEQLKVEFKEISIDEKSKAPITNMIYHLENARNVILNSNSQATFGDVTMTEKAIQDNCTDDVKSLMATINAMKEFCSKFSSTLDIVQIQETVASLESVVASSTIYGSHNQTNSVSTAEFSQSKISKEVASQNLINLETFVEEPNSAKPITEVKIYTKNVFEEKIEIETEVEKPMVTEIAPEEPIDIEPIPENPIDTETVAEKPMVTETAPEEPIDIEPIPEVPIGTETVNEELIVTETVTENKIESETVSEDPIDIEPVPEKSIDLLLIVGVIIVIAFAVGFNILRNK